MGDVISVNFRDKTKTDTNREEHNERVIQSYKLKQDDTKPKTDVALETRINNIRSSLDRINTLMAEFRSICKQSNGGKYE